MFKILPNLIVVISLIFGVVSIVYADPLIPESPIPNPSCQTTEIGCIPTNPLGFASKVYGIGLGMIGGVALLFIIYGGYLIMTSAGNPVKLEHGKNFIVYSIAGVVLAVLGFGLYQILAVDVLKLPGFTR